MGTGRADCGSTMGVSSITSARFSSGPTSMVGRFGGRYSWLPCTVLAGRQSASRQIMPVPMRGAHSGEREVEEEE